MEPWLAAWGLVKVYGGGVVALDGVDVSLCEDVVALVGPNGAGKTTFVRIASALLRPTRGRVEVLGIDVVERPREVRRRVALLPQDAVPDSSLSPLDLVATYLRVRGYGWGEAVRRAREVLESVGLGDRVRVPCSRLSGGMRRLVLVSMVLAPEDVEAVLLDEPGAGLDPVNAMKLWSAVWRRAREGVRVLITSHILHRVEEEVPRVVMLHRGRVVADGSPRRLVEELAQRIARVDVSTPCSEVVGVEGVVKCVDVGGRSVVFVERSALSSFLSEVASRGEASVRRMDLEGVFLWYAH